MCSVKQPSAFDFFQRFPNEDAARTYLETARWPGGIHCLHCGYGEVYRILGGKTYTCKACRKQFTIRTGTVMEKSHIALTKWLYAMYLMSVSRKSVSSIQLAKELGITQKSAWFMLGRLREACGTGGALSGIVEADETFIGGKEKNKHSSKKLRAGRGTVGKTVVFGARSRDGETRAQIISGTDGETIRDVVRQNVVTGSKLYTDEHRTYKTVRGYRHEAINHDLGEYVRNDGVHTNSIESVWAILKRGIMGIYHHVSRKHLQRYLDELTFRLDTKDLTAFDVEYGDCGINFTRCIVAGMEGRRLTYKALIA